jgi:tetratricopeptide (TPR) repeat protein
MAIRWQRSLEVEEMANLLFALADTLDKADPGKTTNAAFAQQLEATLRPRSNRLPEPGFTFGEPQHLFLGNEALTTAHRSLERLAQAPVRETIAFLEEVIARRQERGDLWPDGRLNLGIAYAALGDYEEARRILEEVIDICESGGRYPYGEEMAMAA